MLVAEISSLKARLEAASRESAGQAQRVTTAEKRAEVAETRLREAEKALHDLAGKNALETMAANRKIAELETRLSELNGHFTMLAQEYKAELDIVENRALQLREKLRQLGA